MESVKSENPPILIGSKAIRYYFPSFPSEPKDTDYIISAKIKNYNNL